jgi:fructokinase
MSLKKQIPFPFIVLGEIVWDMFPDARRLGGAPLNFAYYFMKAGGNPFVISAVGRDSLGSETLEAIRCLGLDTSGIQVNDKPTGTVLIAKEGGRNRFRVARDSAWEALGRPSQREEIKSAIGLYVGTLTRVSRSNKALSNALLKTFAGRVKFLDVNLRSPYYSRNDVDLLLREVTHVKMNDSEADLLKGMGFLNANTYEGMAEELVGRNSVDACCITLGARGAVGADRNSGAFRTKGIKARRGGDSVGAGDAFAGFWLYSILAGESMQDAVNKANTAGSIVASHKGAIVESLEI